MVRITGGALKGRALKVYSGGEVRPTSDKVRQALFNILRHRFNADFQGARALDLFAGSGALGLELLSRGASAVCFVESDPKTARVLQENIKAACNALNAQLSEGELPPEVRVLTQRVDTALKRPPALPFDFVLVDPPYAMGAEVELLKGLTEAWLSEGGYVMIEHAKRNLFEPPEGWRLELRRAYGDTLISVCQRELAPSSPSSPPHTP
jgi:16S rRNA (guanine966-N2)-methyltransferase